MVTAKPPAQTDRGHAAEENQDTNGFPHSEIADSADQDGTDEFQEAAGVLPASAIPTPPPPTSLTSPSKYISLLQWLDNRRLLIIIAASLVGLFALSMFYTLYLLKAVMFPIALAVTLKLVFNPVVKWLNNRRIPSFLGAGLVVCGIFGIAVTGIVVLSAPVEKWIDDAPSHIRAIEWKLRSVKEPIEKVTTAGEKLDELTNMNGDSNRVAVQVKSSGALAAVFDTTGEVAVGIFLTLVLLYFLLAGNDRTLEKMIELAPAWRNKRGIVKLARDVQHSMSQFLFVTTCINIILGIVIGAVMYLVGLPNPVLWGVMAACLNYIPYIGCITGACIVFLVGLISPLSLGDAVWAPALYFVINAIEGYFITPSILGRSISLSPLAILISMIVWGWMWGVGGLLLAVPILAASKIACHHIPPLHGVGKLLGR